MAVAVALVADDWRSCGAASVWAAMVGVVVMKAAAPTNADNSLKFSVRVDDSMVAFFVDIWAALAVGHANTAADGGGKMTTMVNTNCINWNERNEMHIENVMEVFEFEAVLSAQFR